MIRGFLYWFIGGLLTLLFFFILLFITPFVKKEDFYHTVIRVWSRILLSVLCGARIEVSGRENLQDSRSYIIASNHRSFTDILVGSAAIPIQFRWLAKRSLFNIPIVGFAMKRAGYISIEREKSVSASRSLETLKEVLRKGSSVWIFPEGTRTRKPGLGSFKRGAFYLARETALPLLPVTFVHTDDIFYRPYIVRARKIKVIVGRPVYCGTVRDERKSIEELMRSVREIIQRNYDANVSPSQ